MTTINSTGTSTASALTAKTGYGGLVSGLDIDELVENLSSSNREKVTKQEQNLQKLEWKQTAYRSVISALSDFQSSYLDILSSTNFGSEAFFNTVEATSSSDAISVSSTAASYEGSFTIESIKQLATAETITSSAAVTKDLISTVSSTALTSSLSALSGKSLKLTLDGNVKIITIDAEFIATAQDTTDGGLDVAFQNAVNKAFGFTDDDNDGVVDSVIDFSISGDKLTMTADGSTLKIGVVDKDTATLIALGFEDGQSNKLSVSTELGELNTATTIEDVETFKFTINGEKFEFSKDVSLSKMISQVNSSSAGVNLSYSDVSDTFTMTADDTGSGDNIVISETSGNIMSALGLTGTGATVTAGKNAILTVDGKQITRSSNEITLNGVSVKLEALSDAKITVTMEADSTTLKDSITKFVEDYNTMIDLVNTYVNEDVDSDYPPLTDAQKDEMSESEIEKWEAKAKSGVLRGDSTLRTIASKLQQTMYKSAVSGGISLYDLGITSAGYSENGKLQIDDDKLTKALKTKSSEISELFTSDKGLASNLKSIINGAVKTSGSQGSRGTLVEIAGVEDTSSSTQNSIYEQIQDMEDLIDTLQDRLTAQEARLWSRFTAMETALQSLNTQSSMISSFFSSGS